MTGKKLDEFHPYVDEFARNLYRFNRQGLIPRLQNLEIVFTNNLPPGQIGACYFIVNRIEILKPYWDKAPIHERDELIQHEIGHCVLMLTHSPPFSIMQASGILGKFYINNYSYLTNQLFGCYTGDCVNLVWNEGRYK